MSVSETENKNKGGMIVLLIFLLVCAGLGIAAFAMAMTKCKKNGFKNMRLNLVNEVSKELEIENQRNSEEISGCNGEKCKYKYNNKDPIRDIM